MMLQIAEIHQSGKKVTLYSRIRDFSRRWKKSEKGFTQHHFKNNGNIPRIIKSGAGFTIIELLVAIGVLATILAISTISLISATHKTNKISAASLLVSDLKSQQLKAMTGDTAGSGNISAWGIHFETDKYILFRGSVYSASNPSNFAIDLTDDVEFYNIQLPNSEVIFASGSGEIANFIEGSNSLTIKAIQGTEQKTLILNKYGVVISD